MIDVKLAVIVTAWRVVPYIRECLDSIMAQSTRPDLVLIMEDASGDETPQTIQQWLSEHGNPKGWVLSQGKTNIGQSENINIGIAKARAMLGEKCFVAIMDGDDIMHPERLQKQAQYLNSHPSVDWVCGSITPFTEENGKRVFSKITSRPYEHHDALKAISLFQSPLYTGMIMLRQERAMQENVLFPNNTWNDWDTSCRFAHMRMAWIQESLQWYRRHSCQVTHSMGDGISSKASEIRKFQLAKIGLTPTDDEMGLHIAISPCDFWAIHETSFFWERKEDLVQQAQGWLTRIKVANAKHKVFEPESLALVCQNVMMNVMEATKNAQRPERLRF